MSTVTPPTLEHGGRALRSLVVKKSGLAGKLALTLLSPAFWLTILQIVIRLLPYLFPLGLPSARVSDPEIEQALKDTQ